ncbi:uncharacterized protein LOC123468971 [Daphnia magna]|uniref:uncharacterized protein LOC123468971 n=1 Tax=Daphnia magna TaxID=35525 RepID=UPI001E1BAC9A|nr:uncharacterized protein LOC123468971 [Daphnia magna]
MGTESPDVWPRTAEISFGNTEVTRHEFYECFEHDSNESDSIIDAVSRLPGRAFCVFRIGFKTVKDHIEFLNKFSAKESVVISGKEVRIRVRDRSVNLVRVRIQHFKFDDDLSLLNKRLREFGVISRVFWDTYQDRSLPRWNGIKTGVVNVDMEIHKGIPSFITFGSYQDPLMVSYAGQMHTCRMCDSPTHVLANCPKQPLKIVRKPQETGPTGGGKMPIAPTVDADSLPELAQRSTMSTVVVFDKAPEDPISKPDEAESLSDTDSDAEDSSCVDSSVASYSVPLEGELQDSPSGGTQNLETETMECSTLTSSLTVPSEDNPSKPIMKSQMTAPDTETQDQEPMTIIMESMEPDMGEIETMGPDKTKDPLRIPTVPRNKRFKPTLTAQNSKPSSGIHRLIKT